MARLATISSVQRMNGAARLDMYLLYARFFDGVTEQSFMQDLAAKKWAIRLWDSSGLLAGFSTLDSYSFEWMGRSLLILFSGDTIVRPDHQSRSGLAGAFGQLARRISGEKVAGECFWFLISKGFRTYRLLPGYFLDFIPRAERSSHPALQSLLHTLAAARFGKHYNPRTGLIQAWPGKDRLKPGMCRVPENYLRCPHVRFFLERNPRFSRGDELACLAPLHPDNLTAAAHRQMQMVSPVWED